MICRGNEVLFVAGVGAGSVPPWKPDIKNLRLKWTGEMPWISRKRKGTDNGSGF